MIWVCGTDKARCRAAFRAKNMSEARRKAEAWGFTEWAAYREVPGFHSTTQREYLIEHHNDTYWLNNGVPSGRDAA